MLNPEIRKHIWLDVSLGKLILVPVTAVLLYLIANPAASFGGWSYTVFYWLGLFFIYIWGLHNAASSIPFEHNQRTWDFVKQASIPPWRFTWGKLFGSTLMPWYGALVFFGFYLFTVQPDPSSSFLKAIRFNHPFLSVAILMLGGIFAHSLGMLFSINSLPDSDSKQSSSFWFFVIVLLISTSLVGGTINTIGIKTSISWYDQTHSAFTFSLTTLTIFTLFAVMGLYRSIKSTFQYTIYPWAWTLFHVVLIVYFSGFSPQFLLKTKEFANMPTEWRELIDKSTIFISLFTSIVLSYFVVFSKNINKLTYNKFFKYFFSGKYKLCLANMPLWIISFVITLVCLGLSIFNTLSITVTDTTNWLSPSKIVLTSIIFVLFLCRDILLHHFLAFGKSEHKSISTLFYLFLLYFLIPWALNVVNLDTLTSFLVLDTDKLEVTLISFSVQIGVLFMMTYRRWSKLWVTKGSAS